MSAIGAGDRRCFLVHGNRAPEGVLSGGDWGGTLDDLLLPTLRQDVARCSSGLLADASFHWRLPKVMTIGALAIVGHTLPGGAKARLTWSRAGVAVGAAAEWRAVFPRVARTRDLSFDDAGWWTGRPSARLRDVYTPTFLAIPDARLRADAVTVEIDARGQAFDLSYLFIASLFRPDWPMAWGREVEPVSRTITDLTPGGRAVHDRRRPLRRQRVTFEDLTKAEAARWLDISMLQDVVEPLLFVPDPGDPINWWREVFLARLTKLTGFTEKDDGYYRVAVEIEEIIA
jgi:hypothetical protein